MTQATSIRPARARLPLSTAAATTLLVLAALILLVPLFWLLVTTLKPESEIGAQPLTIWPANPTLDEYAKATTYIDYGRYLFNSLRLAVIFTIPTVITSMLAGYAFARWRAPGSRALFGVVVGTMLIPLFVFIVPLFVVFSRVGLIGTPLPWLLWGLAASPFHIFLFRQFFDAFPKELEEAAAIDGSNRLTTFLRIVIPNSRPIIATSAILAFTSVWGEVITQSIFLTSDEQTTLSVRLAAGISDPTGNSVLHGPTLAGVAMYVIPIIIVFVIAQRQIIQGVVTSGLK